MRQRVNRAAVCSSDNYKLSKLLHLDFLKEQHTHFKEITVNGEISIDMPILRKGRVMKKFKTIKVFGKDMKVTIDEYNTHCIRLGL